MQDLSVGTAWIHSFLLGYMPEWLAVTLECLLVGVGLMLLYAVLALFYILFERKVCAYFQCRLGPNRVGPWGLLQSVADMFKILIKELISLNHIDKFLFALAPYLVIIASMHRPANGIIHRLQTGTVPECTAGKGGDAGRQIQAL